MKILVVVIQIGKSPAGLVNEKLIKGLTETGHHLFVLCVKNFSTYNHRNLLINETKPLFIIENRINKLSTILFGKNIKYKFWELKVNIKFSNSISKYSPDIIYVLSGGSSEGSLNLGFSISKRIDKPLAVHFVDAIPPPKGWETYEFYRKSLIKPILKPLKHASCFSINTPEMLLYQQKNVNFDLMSKSFVMPDPVFEKKQIFGQPPPKLVFSYIGSFYGPRKADGLIEAFKKFIKLFPEAILQIVGNNDFERLNKLAGSAKSNIKLVKWTNKLDEIYKNSSVLIDVNADIEDDVFVSNKLRYYLTTDRLILCISRKGTASYALLKNLSKSTILTDNETDNIYKSLIKAAHYKYDFNDFIERDKLLETFKLENSVKMITDNFNKIISKSN